MIQSLHLGNFKAFAETQTIPIRPITLIFGANSSGKSSIIHSLLFAQNALETGELDPHRMMIGGESVDLGGFRQFIFGRQSESRMHWGMEFEVASLRGRLEDLLSPSRSLVIDVQLGLAEKGATPRQRIDDTTGHMREMRGPCLLSYELSADAVPILSMTRRPDNTLQMDRLNIEHPVIRHIINAVVESYTLALALSDSDLEHLRSTIDILVPTMKSFGDKLVAENITRFESYEKSREEIVFPVSKGRRGEDLTTALELYLPRMLGEVVSNLYTTLAVRMNDLRYLGPLRSYPPRHFAFAQYHDPNWLAGGGQAWDVVRTDEEVRQKVNAWLGSPTRLQTPYELQIHPLLDVRNAIKQLPDHLFNLLKEAFRSFMKETAEGGGDADSVSITVEEIRGEGELIEGAESAMLDDILSHIADLDASSKDIVQHLLQESPDDLSELVLMDKRSKTPVSHRDVGIGISQVLPVLVSAYANRERLVTIEQPEIHLHPALQAELGDVFIKSALGEQKNTFLLETHSEHIILRILKRIRETTANKNDATPPVRPDDVSLLFVGPGKNGSEVMPIRIDERGRLIDRVPGGFFEEDFAELF